MPPGSVIAGWAKGENARDTAARQIAALDKWSDYITEHAVPRPGARLLDTVHPAAAQRWWEYRNLMNELAPQSSNAQGRYRYNDAFIKSVFTDHLSSEGGSAYRADNQKRIEEVRSAGVPKPPPPPAETSDEKFIREQTAAATAASAKIAESDLAKARDAKVDMKRFNILGLFTLGARIELPDCEARAVEKLCVAGPAITNRRMLGWEKVEVPADKAPSWIRNIYIDDEGGILLGVFIATTGENEEAELQSLRQKFGAPVKAKKGHALHWASPGLYVNYEFRDNLANEDEIVVGTGVAGAAAAGMWAAGKSERLARTPNLLIQLESFEWAEHRAPSKRTAPEPKL